MNNERELLRFLDDPTNNLEEQPTDILVSLAQKLKERRTRHHQEMLVLQEEQEKKATQETDAQRKMVEDRENAIRDEMNRALHAVENDV